MPAASSKRGRPNVMFQIIGIVLLLGLVFGSFIMSGGKMGVILHAAPHELTAILGAGAASPDCQLDVDNQGHRRGDEQRLQGPQVEISGLT